MAGFYTASDATGTNVRLVRIDNEGRRHTIGTAEIRPIENSGDVQWYEAEANVTDELIMKALRAKLGMFSIASDTVRE